ncbi:MAG: hypothetical protein OEX22_07740 [Cyclobacteriaceae bacterium]|nr:hypothetical protein [Cyclobacteriaceae bacterium]
MLPTLLGIGLMALFFILMSVRLIFIKDGAFKGTCASQNPYLNKDGAPCGYCGKTFDAGESCENPENEVEKVMSKFD